MAEVRTVEGDVLDEICWRHYGREDAVPAVLRANPGLAASPTEMPAGILIVLPTLPDPAAAPVDRLWDVAPKPA